MIYLVDVSNVIYPLLLMTLKRNEATPLNRLQSMATSKMKSLIGKMGITQDDTIVLCNDSSNSWRKDILSGYKKPRKRKDKSRQLLSNYRDAIKLRVFDQLKKERYPVVYLTKDRCEADDIIAVVSGYVNDPVTVITNDKDMMQLKSNRIHIFDTNGVARKDKYDLERHIVYGDLSDNIGAISARGNLIINDKKVYQIKENHEMFWKDDKFDLEAYPDFQSSYDRNASLIDLKLIPSEYVDAIKEVFDHEHASMIAIREHRKMSCAI